MMMVTTWLGTLGLGTLIVMLAFYFLPTLIALHRRHPSGLAIFVLNLLLGMTAIGWIVALVWALAAINNDTQNNSGGGI